MYEYKQLAAVCGAEYAENSEEEDKVPPSVVSRAIHCYISSFDTVNYGTKITSFS